MGYNSVLLLPVGDSLVACAQHHKPIAVRHCQPSDVHADVLAAVWMLMLRSGPSYLRCPGQSCCWNAQGALALKDEATSRTGWRSTCQHASHSHACKYARCHLDAPPALPFAELLLLERARRRWRSKLDRQRSNFLAQAGVALVQGHQVARHRALPIHLHT